MLPSIALGVALGLAITAASAAAAALMQHRENRRALRPDRD